MIHLCSSWQMPRRPKTSSTSRSLRRATQFADPQRSIVCRALDCYEDQGENVVGASSISANHAVARAPLISETSHIGPLPSPARVGILLESTPRCTTLDLADTKVGMPTATTPTWSAALTSLKTCVCFAFIHDVNGLVGNCGRRLVGRSAV